MHAEFWWENLIRPRIRWEVNISMVIMIASGSNWLRIMGGGRL
jgi:hypothetical protein